MPLLTTDVPSTARAGAAAALAAACLSACLAIGCAAPGSDRHLAPFYTRASTAHGTNWIELLGGSVFLESEAVGEKSFRRGFRPFYSSEDRGPGDWVAYILVPLGHTRTRHGETVSFLFPFYIFDAGPRADGSFEWRFGGLPGILMKENSVEGREIGWFPFFGRFESFLTFDDLFFVMWPSYIYARGGPKGERVSHHILYPVIGRTTGEGEDSWRVWPLYGESKIEGRYDRRFALWPFFHHHRNNLGGGGEEEQNIWMFFPFYGRTTQGTYRSHTVLWPFFGWARDPRGDFRAWDGPWPFVRFQSGGENTDVTRRRVWPFFSYLETDRMTYRSYLYPLIHLREERYKLAERDTLYVLPFWQQQDGVDLETGVASSWRKLWPLFHVERVGDYTRGQVPALDPLWRNRLIRFHYAWIWKVWEWERRDPVVRQRGWLGLWRREKDAGEDRCSLSFLWSRREYRDARRREVGETSLLFGLLRWRKTEGDGFEMLPPALPGPGWPAERVEAPPGGDG